MTPPDYDDLCKRPRGVGRDADNERCLILYFDEKQTDDQLRAWHEAADLIEAQDKTIAELREQLRTEGPLFTVKQWQDKCKALETAKRKLREAEADNAALRQDAERLDFLLAITTADGAAEDDPRAVAMALAFARGLDGRAAINAAMLAGRDKP